MNAYRLREQHEPTDECNWRHCYAHMVDEVPIGRPYATCGECGHIFPSSHAIRRDHRRTIGRIVRAELLHPLAAPKGYGPGKLRTRLNAIRWMLGAVLRRAKNISACPHCAHDL